MSVIDKARNQDEYNIYVSLLDEEELECLRYVQRLRRHANRQLPTAPAGTPTTDTDGGQPALTNNGRTKNNNAKGQVIDVDIEPTSPDETPLRYRSLSYGATAPQYDNDARLFRTSR